MAENLPVNRLGELVKARRESTIDPLTGRPYTQEGLGKALGVSRVAITAIERGATETIDSDKANRLAELLDLSVDELVVAMGYRIGTGSLSREESELLRVYRRAPADARSGVVSIARSAVQLLLGLQNPEGPPRRAAG